MPGKMKLFFNPQSRAVIARWMLEEVGADYAIVPVEFKESGERDAALLAVNPMGKIPTLVLDDGTVLTEAPAILAWLADAYPDADLAPAVGSSERGSYYRWLFFGGSCFEPALIEHMMRKDVEPLSKVLVGWGSYDDVVDTIEKTLAGRRFLVGDRFTAADLYIGSQLFWAGMFKAPRIGESEVLQGYLAQMQERPAFQRAFGG